MSRLHLPRVAAALAAAASLVSASAQQPDEHVSASPDAQGSPVRVPPAMATEHEELHEQLAAAIAAGGETAAAARRLEEHLAPHFDEENRYALPPLGLLPALAEGRATEEMRPAIEMGRHVEQNLDRYLEEHRAITRAVTELGAAAEAEGKAEQVRFAAALRAHAQHEEELFYPMAILIGRYVERELATH